MMMKEGKIVDRGQPDELIDRYGPHQPRRGFSCRSRAACGPWSRWREHGACRAGSTSRRALRRLGEAAFSPARVWAMLLRYLYILKSSWPRTIELLYWPTCRYDLGVHEPVPAHQQQLCRAGVRPSSLGAVMLWDLLFRSQLGLSMSFLEEMWRAIWASSS